MAKALPLFAILVFTLFSCNIYVADINYMGQELPKTDRVKMYYPQDTFPHEAQQIGQAVVTSSIGHNFDQVINKVRRNARRVGATHVHVRSFKIYASGRTVSTEGEDIGSGTINIETDCHTGKMIKVDFYRIQ